MADEIQNVVSRSGRQVFIGDLERRRPTYVFLSMYFYYRPKFSQLHKTCEFKTNQNICDLCLQFDLMKLQYIKTYS